MVVVLPRRPGGRERTEYLPPAEQASLLSELGQRSGQAIEGLGLLLDTPGAIVRGIAAGDPLSGFTFDRSRRVTGEELLDAYGLKPSNPYASTAAGFAVDVLTDPLLYFSFPMSARGLAGAAAEKAGVMKYARNVASAKAGADATRAGAYTLRSIQKAGLNPTPSVLQTRPLVGPRLSAATTTLDEAVRAADDPLEALRNVQAALGSTPYDAVKDDKLGGLFGWSNPFTGASWAYNPRGSGAMNDLTDLLPTEKAADFLDRLGQGIRWSAPIRYASSMFDEAVGGQIGVADQITAMRRYEGEQMARRAGRDEATKHAQQLYELQIPEPLAQQTGVSDFFSPEGGQVLRRLLEGKPIGNDTDFLSQVPGLDDWIVNWRMIAQNKLDAAKSLGLSANELQDKFRAYFTPRSAPELDFSDIALRSGRGSQFSAFIGNQVARNPDLQVPGGTYQLQQISVDPVVRAWAKGTTNQTEAEIGLHIHQMIGNPLVTEQQAQGIARVMRRIMPELPDDIALFGTHPLIEQMGYIINEDIRRSNAMSAFEAIADAAVMGRRTQIPGGKHLTLSQAMERLGERLGIANRTPEARDQIRTMLANRLFPGANPSTIRMGSISVPEEVVNRITRISDFYNAPLAQKEVSNLFDQYTTLFKASVLAWPSRFARDAYSNVFSVWLETGRAGDTFRGMSAASHLLNNNYDGALKFLREIPRYAGNNLTDADRIRLFQQDVGRTGILSGLATTDLLSANRRGDIGQFIPGSTPISVGRSLAELAPQPGLSMQQRVGDFFQIKGVTNRLETRNPIYNASNALGDTVDSVGRLGGFMALMHQGVAPEEAAARIMHAMVDYSSLTPLERGLFRRIFPWWAYSSRIGAYAVNSILKSPGGRYAQTIRGLNDLQASTEESYIPVALRQRTAVRIPEFGNTSGPRTYLTDIDLPGIDVLNILRLGYQPDTLGSLLQTSRNTIGELVNQSNPLARTVLELGTGQDFFSKRPIEQAVTPLDTIRRSLTGDKYARFDPLTRAAINLGLNVVPLGQRSVSALASAVDARIPSVPFRAAKTLINNLTGVKLQTIDDEYEALDALSKIREQQAPYSSEFVQSYIPEDLLPRVPYQTQRLNALSKELQRQVRDLNKQRYER